MSVKWFCTLILSCTLLCGCCSVPEEQEQEQQKPQSFVPSDPQQGATIEDLYNAYNNRKLELSRVKNPDSDEVILTAQQMVDIYDQLLKRLEEEEPVDNKAYAVRTHAKRIKEILEDKEIPDKSKAGALLGFIEREVR